MNVFQVVRKVFESIRQKPIDALILLVFILVILKLLSLYNVSNVDDAEWERFKKDNNCAPLITNGGQSLGWQCKDGRVHYRWRQQR
jgi:hypothetical protein